MTKGSDAVIIAGAVAGEALESIASRAGVSVSTVQRRLKDPHVAEATEQGRQEVTNALLSALTSAQGAAVARLVDVMHGDDDALAVRAAGMLLSTGARYHRGLVLHQEMLAIREEIRGMAENSPDAANGGPSTAALALSPTTRKDAGT